jgi:hypothetical protein
MIADGALFPQHLVWRVPPLHGVFAPPRACVTLLANLALVQPSEYLLCDSASLVPDHHRAPALGLQPMPVLRYRPARRNIGAMVAYASSIYIFIELASQCFKEHTPHGKDIRCGQQVIPCGSLLR